MVAHYLAISFIVELSYIIFGATVELKMEYFDKISCHVQGEMDMDAISTH